MKIVLERMPSHCRIEGNEMKNRLKFNYLYIWLSQKEPRKNKEKECLGEREMLKNVSSSSRQNQARRQLKMTEDLDQVFLRENTL